MAVTFSGIAASATSVTITGGVAVEPFGTGTGEEPIGTAKVQSNGTTAVTLYTPTAGKTFYLTGMYIEHQDGSIQEVKILDSDGTSTLYSCNFCERGASMYISTFLTLPNFHVWDDSHPLKFKLSSAGSATSVTVFGVEK